MEPHDSEKHPEPGSLTDSPEFHELAEIMRKIPPERRADAFSSAAAGSPHEARTPNDSETEDDSHKAEDDPRSPPRRD